MAVYTAPRHDRGRGPPRPLEPLAARAEPSGRAPLQPAVHDVRRRRPRHEHGRRLRRDPLGRSHALRDLRRRGLRCRRLGPPRRQRRSRADRVRGQIDRSIGPVWEANHVWLIFVLVVLWTAFPVAFSAIMTTALHPAGARRARDRPARLGLRLPACAARDPSRARRPGCSGWPPSSPRSSWGPWSGAIASGEVPAAGDGDPTGSWTGFLPLVTGALFVLVAAYTAAVFLVRDSGTAGDQELRDYFARRALIAAVVAGSAARCSASSPSTRTPASSTTASPHGPVSPW